MKLKNSDLNTSAQVFRQAVAIINLVTIAHFFETTCISIFKRFLAVGLTNNRFFRSVLTYFRIVKTNGQKILDLYFLA